MLRVLVALNLLLGFSAAHAAAVNEDQLTEAQFDEQLATDLTPLSDIEEATFLREIELELDKSATPESTPAPTKASSKKNTQKAL